MSIQQQPTPGSGTAFNIPVSKKKQQGILPRMHAGNFSAVIENRINQMGTENLVRRFWEKDESLWGEHPKTSISSFMGWCDILDDMLEQTREIEMFAAGLLSERISDVVLLGMGGSSLAPLVLQEIFAKEASGLTIHVIDTTDAEAISSIEEKFSLEHTLFILASKSGSTAEPNALFDYFYNKVSMVFNDDPGSRFIAITDPGTSLNILASERGFRKTFFNFENVGGRFSALTYFGLLPAALAGIDPGELLKRAIQLKVISELESELAENPGFVTGIALGELARNGRDKLTFILPKEFQLFYLWLEQLIAESTGKHGKGILPVKYRKTGETKNLSQDRVFVHYYYEGRQDENEETVNELVALGYPVMSISLADNYDIGREFFRWEMATAVASMLILVNPFDQPDVQSAKDNTKAILAKMETTGKIPARKVSFKEDCLRFLYNGSNLSGAEIFKDFFSLLKPGDYIGLLAYINEDESSSRQLEEIALVLEKKFGTPVTIGYGPRYLHSTGQFHKGGVNRGFFIEIISEGMAELPIPGRTYSFSQLIMAQALGDYESLTSAGRKVLRVDIGKNRKKGLLTLTNTIFKSLIM